jgi:spermidine synthase
MSQPALSETQRFGAETRHTEFWFGRSGISFGIAEKLHEEQSEYQKVEVFETEGFGTLLTLTGWSWSRTATSSSTTR